ncbi:unnamed protein product [Rhizophagus irregularis]|nr:unnamed protein product [Rhizophagus irregularis]CAB5367399.1 unnamed protein product [Rhizophagus irregularis]
MPLMPSILFKTTQSLPTQTHSEALLLSEIVSLQLLAKECDAREIAGVCDLLQRSSDKIQDVVDEMHLEHL